MADEAGGAPRRGPGCGVGTQLRNARERAGLTVAQAARQLHVASETLEALEAEQFDVLGAPIYVKGYVGRYAELLGESPEALQAQLTSAVLMPPPDLTRVPQPIVPVQGRRHTAVVVSGIVVLLVAGALGWWAWSSHPVELALLLPFRQGTRPTASLGHPGSRSSPARSAPPAPPRAGAAAPAQATATPAQAAAAASVQAAATAGKGTVRITVQFPAASWAAVSDATGHPLYRGLVSAGTTKSFAGPAPLHVVLGYADGVTLMVDGHAAPIGSYVGRDHAVSIAVSAGGRISPVPWHPGG